MRLGMILAGLALATSGCGQIGRLQTDISAPAPSIGKERLALANNLANAFRRVSPDPDYVGCIKQPGDSTCIVFRTDKAPIEIAAYLSSAYALTDELCDTFFRATNAAARHRENVRADVNDLGTLITAILGLSNAGSIATSAVASVAGFGDNVIRNYDAAYLVSPDLAALQPLVHAEQSELRRATTARPPATWGDARSAALRYAEPCTYTGMKRLLTKSAQVLTTVKTETSLSATDIRAIASTQPALGESTPPAAAIEEAALPTVRWGSSPERLAWTRTALEEVRTAGGALWADGFRPSDITDFCPDYDRRGPADRQAFWVGLLTAMAEKETSGFDPRAVGDGGNSIGLLQLSLRDRTAYDCAFLTEAAIVEADPNIRCAVRILTRLVQRDGVIASGVNSDDARGAARYWGPLRRAARKEIASWTAQQNYCKVAS